MNARDLKDGRVSPSLGNKSVIPRELRPPAALRGDVGATSAGRRGRRGTRATARQTSPDTQKTASHIYQSNSAGSCRRRPRADRVKGLIKRAHLAPAVGVGRRQFCHLLRAALAPSRVSSTARQPAASAPCRSLLISSPTCTISQGRTPPAAAHACQKGMGCGLLAPALPAEHASKSRTGRRDAARRSYRCSRRRRGSPPRAAPRASALRRPTNARARRSVRRRIARGRRRPWPCRRRASPLPRAAPAT